MPTIPDEPKLSCRYRISRYMPNPIRDEWINVGVLLEELPGQRSGAASARLALRFVEEDTDIARLCGLHPAADERLLRALPAQFDQQLRAVDASTHVEKLDQLPSNAVQVGPQKGVLTADFDAELDRLFRDQVAALPGEAGAFSKIRAFGSGAA